MDEPVYEDDDFPSWISAVSQPADLNPATGTSDVPVFAMDETDFYEDVDAPSRISAASRPADLDPTTGTSDKPDTTGCIPGSCGRSPGLPKIFTSAMMKASVVVTIVMFCCMLGAIFFLDLKLSASKQNNQKATGDLSDLKLSISKQSQATTDGVSDLKWSVLNWFQQTWRKTANLSGRLEENEKALHNIAADVAQLIHSRLEKEKEKEKKKTMQRTEVTCPGDYQKYREVCYKAFDTMKTFDESAKTCLADGGTLAMPRDAGINGFLIALKNGVKMNGDFWFGLQDQREEGKWEWIDGTALGTSYNAWSPGGNDGRDFEQDCAMYFGIQWFGWNCVVEDRFICQPQPSLQCSICGQCFRVRIGLISHSRTDKDN
ncbi:CLEC4M [Branchiostoma lanceolatum]|uniref:CLEC4M protein n=1 Tax=Branchiostoma lanceolatum TaxID=7740 RepID=A0A8K0A5N6_BRALA|nr:CLEC4M [Branchiostoma lanceolatum]